MARSSNTKAEMKFNRVMHEFGQGKLKSHDKVVTDQKQAVAIAFSEARKVNLDYGMKSNGGRLEEIYSRGTAEDLWNTWDEKERKHFLSDHAYLIEEKLNMPHVKGKNFADHATDNYSDLAQPIKQELVIHHAMGIYAQGGGIMNQNNQQYLYQTEIFDEGGQIKKWSDVKEFLESELPKKLPSAKEKINVFSIKDEKDFDTASIKPIPYKIKDIPEPLINIVSDDELRPVMQAIYYNSDKKEKVATDAHVLVVIKDKSIKKTELINPETKQGVDGRYPNYEAVIPKENPYKIHISEQEVLKLMNQLNGMARASRFFDWRNEKNIVARLKYDDADYYVNPKLFLTLLTTLWQYGARSFNIEFSSPTRAIVVKDSGSGNMGLIMPIVWHDEFIGVNVLDESKTEIIVVPVEKHIEKKDIEKKDKKPERKKYDTLHSCAVRLGRKGGIASAKQKAKRMDGGGRLSPSKQKIKARIDKLSSSVEKMSDKTKEVVQKKINQLQKQLDYNPTAKERAQANKGKFALDVPTAYSKRMYKQLWRIKIFPRLHKLNGTTSIVVNSGTNLNKAYSLYSDMLKEDDKKVPALSKISRKL